MTSVAGDRVGVSWWSDDEWVSCPHWRAVGARVADLLDTGEPCVFLPDSPTSMPDPVRGALSALGRSGVVPGGWVLPDPADHDHRTRFMVWGFADYTAVDQLWSRIGSGGCVGATAPMMATVMPPHRPPTPVVQTRAGDGWVTTRAESPLRLCAQLQQGRSLLGEGAPLGRVLDQSWVFLIGDPVWERSVYLPGVLAGVAGEQSRRRASVREVGEAPPWMVGADPNRPQVGVGGSR